jgi:hypothetical protein
MAGCAPLDDRLAGLEAAALPQDDLQPLPCERVLCTPALLSIVFAALPHDARLLCREVCTTWCRVLDDTAFWTELDFSDVTHEVNEALLTAAAACAAGGLRSLVFGQPPYDLWDEASDPEAEVGPALLQVLRDNAATLRVFDAAGFPGDSQPDFPALLCSQVATILAAAPALETLKAHVFSFNTASLVPVLQRDGVQIEALSVQHEAQDMDAPRVRELATAIARQRNTLSSVQLLYVPLDAAPEELFDAMLACPLLTNFGLHRATVSRDALAGLARLLRADVVESLSLSEMVPSADLWESREAAMEFAASLRACTRLKLLSLDDMGLLVASGSIGAEAALMASLVGHPSVEILDVKDRIATGQLPALLGAWLGAIVAANTPALHHFSVSCASLSDADLLPFFTALPFNTHLRTIVIFHHNLSIDFMRDVALPAIRANTSLRRASVPIYSVNDPEFVRDLEAGNSRAVALKDIAAHIEAALSGRGQAAES